MLDMGAIEADSSSCAKETTRQDKITTILSTIDGTIDRLRD